MASQDWFEKDFYAILGVPQDADAATIKKTYRKLARDLHPDHNVGDAKAEERFKEIGEAYAVLSDPEQRREYDAIRAMSHGGARFTAGRRRRGRFRGHLLRNFRRRRAAGPLRHGGAGQPNIEDLLGQMFGGGGAGFPGGGAYPAGSAPRPARGPAPTCRPRREIGFRDAVEGSTVTLSSPDSAGSRPGSPRVSRTARRSGCAARVVKGDPGAPAGDLILTVSVDKHPVFGREGDNLTIDLPVTFAEAALGSTVAVPTLDGGSVKVKIAPGTPSGRVLRLKGRGVKRGDKAGDLLAKVQVVVPQRLTDEAREAIETMAKAEDGQDPRADLFERARL